MLHIISLARIIVLNVANWPADLACDGLRLRIENDRLRGEIEMLKQELLIKDGRFARLNARKRPHYRIILNRSRFGGGNRGFQRHSKMLDKHTDRRFEKGQETGDKVFLPTENF